ncbi:hypothetical protein RhiirC2_712571, partial [Rhizophagus irregularis]
GLDCGLLRFCCRSCVSRASDCRDFDRILIRVQENAELKDKNAEIPDLKRKFAEIESEKVELKTRIAELLRQAVEESKRRNVENAELKARIEELEKHKADSSAENVRRDVEFAELKTEVPTGHLGYWTLKPGIELNGRYLMILTLKNATVRR